MAAITGVLLQHGVNIEDSQATILRGHFSIVLIIAAPDDADAGRLAADVEWAGAELGLEAVVLRDVAELAGAAPEPSHMVAVYGVDHPAIVHGATSALAERGIDITDLNTRLVEDEDEGEEPLYALMMEVALPQEIATTELEEALHAVGETVGSRSPCASWTRTRSRRVAVRKVLRYPHPSLKAVCRDPDASEMKRVTGDLLDTMDSYGHCVGLAAPQLDELVRIVAVDVSEHPKATTSHGRLVLVCPHVVRHDGAEVAREGCLSIPHLTANVRRSTRVVIEARDGVRVDTEGFEARCLLNEIDHLDGVLFLDRVDSLATDVCRRKRYQR